MKTNEIRTKFLNYFKDNGHTIVNSSPLVPGNDPTLLFTNAGMVQFKDVFLGHDKRHYTRATSSQRCVRAGGKHNDLENVGYTARHHTFFEMLGNFSFGDYFKKEAIAFAWEFLTTHLKLPKEKLWVTVFKDDKEAEAIWLNEIKIDPTRFSRCGEKDNFWSMGETGPCGPCTEIFYDHGDDIPGGPPGSPDEDGDRYIEIWNLVFMQYNRDKSGQLTPLPKPSVDTGMGLERIAAVLQGVHNNYDIDIFKHLITEIGAIINVQELSHQSLRVIADHIRSCSFLIVDGVLPSNEGRGYVLRRIIRRAVRHGHKLGHEQPFFYRAVAPLVKVMGEAYPELADLQSNIEKVLYNEEIQFSRTLEQGLKILETDLENLQGKEIPGETIFKLYDTYGFPVDLTGDIAREKALTLDMAGFEKAMDLQRSKSKASMKFFMNQAENLKLDFVTEFSGYQSQKGEATVLAIYHNEKSGQEIQANDQAIIILDKTPFYAESGGQVGDHGVLVNDNVEVIIEDTSKHQNTFLHLGQIKSGKLKVGDKVRAEIDVTRRTATMLNHSATHLLHAALRQVLGTHVQQKGSLVEPSYLRFDFSHFEALSHHQVLQIEQLVNKKIRENLTVVTEVMAPEDAQKSGAIALFGEKYGDKVRVLTMGQFSKELCGGTHVKQTGEIGLFKITLETSIASGVRRIIAVTGDNAIHTIEAESELIERTSSMLKATREDLITKLQQQLDKSKQLEKELQQLKQKLAKESGNDLIQQAKDIGEVKLLAAEMPNVDVKTLRDTVDQLKNKLGKAVIILASIQKDNKVSLIAGVTKNETSKIKAGDLLKHVAVQIDGHGGGRPDLAQGGGNDASKLTAALQSVPDYVSELLNR